MALKVKAKALGYYGHKRRRVGEVFSIEDEDAFSEKWMEKAEGEDDKDSPFKRMENARVQVPYVNIEGGTQIYGERMSGTHTPRSGTGGAAEKPKDNDKDKEEDDTQQAPKSRGSAESKSSEGSKGARASKKDHDVI